MGKAAVVVAIVRGRRSAVFGGLGEAALVAAAAVVEGVVVVRVAVAVVAVVGIA